MCGIVGQIRFTTPIDRELLNRQRDSLVHRGPDSCGTWVSANETVGFAHRRLAIIDLSEGGHQPMLDSSARTAITFNGEIYNYLELKAELMALGSQFRSSSDTEVLLCAYEKWGVDFVRRIEGMFAFALFDSSRQIVLLARDRAGEKPLYISRTSHGVSFASEVKALLQDPQISRTSDLQSLNEYLTYGYCSGRRTMFSDIEKLAPGHAIQVDLKARSEKVFQYWSLPNLAANAADVRLPDLADRLQSVLSTAVKRQLLSDVPIGVLLSGGVDSSIIAAIASRVSSTRIQTFTARFPGFSAVDEGPYARLVAKHIDSEHHELETAPADESLLRALVAQFDDPIADSSFLPTFLLSKEIRQFATVAIGGDGGDELFGGYRHYASQLRWSRLRARTPKAAQRLLRLLADALPEDAKGTNALAAVGSTDARAVALGGRIFRPHARAAMLGLAASDPAIMIPELQRELVGSDRSGIMQFSTAADFRSYMVDDVLVKVDRASMLASLEVRAPFLDRAVIEFAFQQVPDDLKVQGSARKILLRELGRRLLPAQLDLTRKQGFDIPLAAWINGPWRSLIRELSTVRSRILVRNDLRKYADRSNDSIVAAERVFSLMLLLMWEQHYQIEGLV